MEKAVQLTKNQPVMYKLQINRGNGWGPHRVFRCEYSEHDAVLFVAFCNLQAKKKGSYYYGSRTRKVEAIATRAN